MNDPLTNGLAVPVRADIGAFSRDMRTAQRQLAEMGPTGQRAGAQMERGFGAMTAAARTAASAFSGLAVAAALAGTARAFVSAADTAQQLGARAKLAGIDLATLGDLAKRTGSSLEATVATYGRLAANTQQLGLTSRDLLQATEALQLSLRVSGASAQEAAAAQLQFAQAMASGVLQGDELRSLLEASPRLAKALADGLGVATGELKKMGSEGQLTAGRVLPAVLSQLGALREEAKGLPDTLGIAAQKVSDSFTLLAGQIDSALGVTRLMVDGLNGVADAMDRIGGNVSAAQRLADVRAALDALRREPAGPAEAFGRDQAAQQRAIARRFGERAQGLGPNETWLGSEPAEVTIERERVAALGALDAQRRRQDAREVEEAAKATAQQQQNAAKFAKDVETALAAQAKQYAELTRQAGMAADAAERRRAGEKAVADLLKAAPGADDAAQQRARTQAEAATRAAQAERAERALMAQEQATANERAAQYDKDREEAGERARKLIQEDNEAAEKRRKALQDYIREQETEVRLAGLSGVARAEEEAVIRAMGDGLAKLAPLEEQRVRAGVRMKYEIEQQNAALKRQQQELDRLAGRIADQLVDTTARFFENLFDGSRDFWDDFLSLAKRTLAQVAAEMLIRGPATAFAQGLVGGTLGGAGAGSGGGILGGLGGSIGQSVAGNAITKALGLDSIGSQIGEALGLGSLFGGTSALTGFSSLAASGIATTGTIGLGAAGSAPLLAAATPAMAADFAIGAGLGASGATAAGAGGFLAAAAPIALPIAAIAGIALLSGAFKKESVGPNASARIGLNEATGQFFLKGSGSDNGGEQFLSQAESGAMQAIQTLNTLASRLGRSFDKAALQEIADPGLAVQFGEKFRRGPEELIRDVLESGALGDLTSQQVQDALNGLDPLAREMEALREAMEESGIADAIRAQEDALREQQRIVERFEQERLRQQQDLVDALREAAETNREAAAGLRRAIADLSLSDLSPLTPQQRLAEARRQFREAVAAGDAELAASAGRTLTQEGVSFFGGATAGAVETFDEVLAGLDGLARQNDRDAIKAEASLRVAEAQLAAMTSIDTVTAAQAAAAQKAAAAAEAQLAELQRQSGALAAIEKALREDSPSAKALKAALDQLTASGAGQSPLAQTLRDYLTAFSGGAAATGNVVPLKPSSGGSTAGGGTSGLAVAFDLSPFGLLPDGSSINMMGDGGVVSRPTLAVIGERPGESEAVIPLKNGAVPVQMVGGGSSGPAFQALAAENAALRVEVAGMRGELRRVAASLGRLVSDGKIVAGSRR